MSYGIHPAAREEYLNAIRWMTKHHYDVRALGRFIDEIETGFIVIDNRTRELPEDPCGRPGWRFYGPMLSGSLKTSKASRISWRSTLLSDGPDTGKTGKAEPRLCAF